jgi:multiple sugar transport system permease protein
LTLSSAPAATGGQVRARRGGRAGGASRSGKAGYAFVGGYVVLLVLFGIAPTGYAIYLALTTRTAHFAGVSNFTNTYNDFRFLPAFKHVAQFMVIWLASQAVFVVGLALMLHTMTRRLSSAFRFLFYLPGALAGAASVLVWLFLLDPSVSPWHFVLSALGYSSLGQSILPAHLPLIFAFVAFWTGAGGWIVVMYGALNNIPNELIEAAELDGAGAFRTALSVKLPLIKKWVVYMLILSFAAGTQLFVEPELVGQASLGLVSQSWSPNQLAYVLAFQNDNFNGAAAISVDLLVLGLLCAAALVFRTKLFEVE